MDKGFSSNGCSDSCLSLAHYQAEAEIESAPELAIESAPHSVGQLSLAMGFLARVSGCGLVCETASRVCLSCSASESSMATESHELELVVRSMVPRTTRSFELVVGWPIERGGWYITMSSGGQLLDDGLTKFPELLDSTGSSHYAPSVSERHSG